MSKKKEKHFGTTFRSNTKEWRQILEVIRDLNPVTALELLQNKIEKVPIDYFVERDMNVRRLSGLLKSKKAAYKHLQGLYERLNQSYDEVLAIHKNAKPQPIKIRRSNLSKKQAVAILQWSDWHVGESVEKKQTNGLNEYNDKIAATRVNGLIGNTIAMLKKERQTTAIDDIVIHLGGDFIGGWIHPELEQTNAISPIEETVLAQNLLIGAIEVLLKELSPKRLVLLCNVGNHGRMTRKMQFANQIKTSYEYMIFAALAKHFNKEFAVSVVIPNGDICYYPIYDKNIRYIHGHQIRYGGGIGGVAIPLNKKLRRWDETKKADFTFLGHFHTYHYPTKNSVINGSLKGYDTFAQSIGAAYEPPTQSLQVFDPNRWLIGTRPVFCD